MNDSDDSSTNPPDDDVSTKEYVNKLFDSSSPEKPEEPIVEEYDPEAKKKTVKKKPVKKKPSKKKPAKKTPAKKTPVKKKQKPAEAESKTAGVCVWGGKTKSAGDGWGMGTMVSAYWPATDPYYGTCHGKGDASTKIFGSPLSKCPIKI